MYNKVIIIGNLTRNLELRLLRSGAVVGRFGIATTRKYGEDKQETFFGEVVVWGRMAELCNEYIGKGSRVFIEGRLITEQFEQHGEKKQKTRIVAENIRFLDRKKESVGSGDIVSKEITEIEPF